MAKKEDIDVTDDERGLLSDEEIAALDDETEEPEEEQEAGSEEETEEETKQASAEDEKAGEEPEQEPEKEPEKAQARDPEILATKYEPEQIADIDARLTELDSKHDEGEISESEWRAQTRALTIQKTKMEMAAEFNRQTDEQNWQFCQKLFFDDHPGYAKEKNPALYGALCAEMEVLASDQEVQGKSYLWYLREAKSRVDKAFNLNQPEMPQPAPPQDKGKAQKAMAEKAQPKPPTPKTLGDVPADAPTSEIGAFDKLDTMDGMEAERAFAGLSSEDQEKYLTQH